MGSSNSIKMKIPIKVLKQFKEYEDKIYSDLSPDTAELQDNLYYYLIPKKYIIDFNYYFYYWKNFSELERLNFYLKTPQTDENIIITKKIIDDIKKDNPQIFDFGIKLIKINNKILIEKRVDGDKYLFKLDNENSLFVPLTEDMWVRFKKHYKCDIELKRSGFINHGEIFIITEEKRLDTYFIHRRTFDKIYHFCLIMEDNYQFKKLVKYLKYNSVKQFFDKLEIKHIGEEINSEKFIKKKIVVPEFITELEKYEITVIFLDSYNFHEFNKEHFSYFTQKDALKSIINFDDNFINNNNLNNNINPHHRSSYSNNFSGIINNLNINNSRNSNNLNPFKTFDISNNNNNDENKEKKIYFSSKEISPAYDISLEKNKKSLTNKNPSDCSIQSKNPNLNNCSEQSKIEYSNHINISMGYKSTLESYSDKNSINNDIRNSNVFSRNSIKISNISVQIIHKSIDCVIRCFLNINEISNLIINLEEKEINKNNINILKLLNLFVKNNSNESMQNKLTEEIDKCLSININQYENYVKKILVSIMDLLDKELAGQLEKNIKIQINQHKSEAYNFFLKECYHPHKISKLYIGILKKKYICSYCQTKHYRFKTFNIFKIEVEKKKLNKIDNNDYLDFQKYLSSDSKKITSNWCICQNKDCGNKEFIMTKTIFQASPNVFIIGFDNNLGNKKLSFNIDFIPNLDITKYIEYKNKNSNFQYQLNSFIEFDQNTNEYISYLKVNNIWYKYGKEDKTQVISIPSIQNPQILFYEKQQLNNF